ncbi:uncharacterized protein LOC117317935 [Pecten maximus]|uniref:uncharacterized protein LOC117317935 n=1 Tax=Pecten maximus TaxID=6579 RepID=UPI0014581CC0|nr:uncharacterized protein LOC117317935 [Pecten maximus]
MLFAIALVYSVLLVTGKTTDIQTEPRDADATSHLRSSKILLWENIIARGECGFPMFTCPSTGVCLYLLSELCDGRFNCYNGEDERHCTAEDKYAIEFIGKAYGYTEVPTTSHPHNHHHHHHTPAHASTPGSGHHFVPITQQPVTTSKPTTTVPTSTTVSPSPTVTPHWIKFTQSTMTQGLIMPYMGKK